MWQDNCDYELVTPPPPPFDRLNLYNYQNMPDPVYVYPSDPLAIPPGKHEYSSGKKIKTALVCEHVYCVKLGKGLKPSHKACESDRQKLILFNNFNLNLLGWNW